MNILSQQAFSSGMDLLESAYGSEFPVFADARLLRIWYKHFSCKYSDREFEKVVEHYISNCSYFPKAPAQMCEAYSKADKHETRSPGENCLALPSTQINAESLSPEKIKENFVRVRLIVNLTMGKAQCIGREEKVLLLSELHKMPLDKLKAFVDGYQRTKPEIPRLKSEA